MSDVDLLTVFAAVAATLQAYSPRLLAHHSSRLDLHESSRDQHQAYRFTNQDQDQILLKTKFINFC